MQSGDSHNTRQNETDNKTRLRLTGIAVLERPNLPVLSASYEYWTDHAENFFRTQVKDFKSMEINQIEFGVNCYPDRNTRKWLAEYNGKGKTETQTWKKPFLSDWKPLIHSGHSWTKAELVKTHDPIRNKDIFKGFFIGLFFCMFVVFILYQWFSNLDKI